jgi:hypothetical protein
MGKPFMGKHMEFPVKITDSGLGEWFTGLETLSTSASDTVINLSYAQTAFAQPVVSIMLESFANSGSEGVINLDAFKLDEAVAEMVSRIGDAAFGDGSGDQMLGLEALVDDGTNHATLGGQSRSTYTNLKSTVTASGGTLTLAKLGTLNSTVSANGIGSEEPSINVTTPVIWDLFESLLQPQVRAEYASVGYNKLPMRGTEIVRPGQLQGNAGFTALTFRGRPAIKDDKCTSGVWYMINENYLYWAGRTQVPSGYAGSIEKVSIPQARVLGGVAADRPSNNNGFFFQKQQMLPNQAGMVGRYYVIGQTVTNQPRRHGKLTGITSV